MIDIQLDENVIEDLELTRKELRIASHQTVSRVTRSLRAEAVREIVKATGLKTTTVRRRVKSYPARGKVWIGGNRVLVTSLKETRLRKRRNDPAGRASVIKGGTKIPKAFAITGKTYSSKGNFIKNVPFRPVLNTIETVTEELRPEFRRGFNRIADIAQNKLDTEFRSRAESIIRART